MRNEILENKEFNILSRSIDNASTCIVNKVSDDCFDVKLSMKGKYEIDESVELFAMTQNGQLYFETIVKEVNDDIITLWYPINCKYLQRREYSRISVDKEIELFLEEKKIPARIIDISAGGLKVITDEQLNLLGQYSLSIEVDGEVASCLFEPIRIEANNNKFISSGRFNNISSHDRIALVQYCFRKQIEISNK